MFNSSWPWKKFNFQGRKFQIFADGGPFLKTIQKIVCFLERGSFTENNGTITNV